VNFIGAGNYARSMLIPAFKKAGANFNLIADNTGINGVYVGRKYGFLSATTNVDRIFMDEKSSIVVIASRHDSHANFIIRGLENQKNIFVEKPICLTLKELDEIEITYNSVKQKFGITPLLMVGFNRRFAPQIQKIKDLLRGVVGPKSFIMTINAGTISKDHWIYDRNAGGGRIIGEACHFIDLIRFLADSPIVKWNKSSINSLTEDTVTIVLNFLDGSIGTIHYFSNGSKSFPKERLEIFTQGRVLLLENFRKLTGFGWPDFKRMNTFRQDKGQVNCVNNFIKAVINCAPSPIPFSEVIEVARVSIEIGDSSK
jgi:predicted dehydrogenase